jgi:hypothetical protein
MDTFVVRVWGQLADGEEEAGLRGVVEHIASGQSHRFRTAEELVSFLRSPSDDLPVVTDAALGGPGSVG